MCWRGNIRRLVSQTCNEFCGHYANIKLIVDLKKRRIAFFLNPAVFEEVVRPANTIAAARIVERVPIAINDANHLIEVENEDVLLGHSRATELIKVFRNVHAPEDIVRQVISRADPAPGIALRIREGRADLVLRRRHAKIDTVDD